MEINFVEGEKILKEIRPLPRFKLYYTLSNTTWFLSFFIPFFLFLSVLLLEGIVYYAAALSLVLVLSLFLVFIVLWIISSLKYKWEYYWLTNKRIIQRKGLIGHSISSVPYERISDVIVSRNWLEKLLGIGSLRIQTLAGQISGRGRWGAEITMLALDNPEQIQSLIFSLVKKNIEKI